GEQGEGGDLAPDLAEGLLRRLVDLALGLREPALTVLLDLAAEPLALRVCDLPRLREDLLGLPFRLTDERAVLLEQRTRLFTRAIGLFDRLPDPVAAVVDQLLDRTECVALQDPERDREGDDRPDHQPRDDLDQRVRGDNHR